MYTPKSTEAELLEVYLNEANTLLSKKFNKKRTYAFTQKWIDCLITHPGSFSKYTDQELEQAKTLSASEAGQKILDGEFTYEDLLCRLQEVKRRCGNENNYLTWSFFEEPLRRAKEIDLDIQIIGREKARVKYPLLGYVMSIKDSVYIKGAPCTVGLSTNLNRVPTEDPDIIAAMKEAGAIMTSKGNVPMLNFSMESINNIYGESKHPMDPTRSVGGSCGGDSGLVVTGVNNSSFGSDLAGSLRIPALFNGLYSLKPSWNRVSSEANALLFLREFGSDRFPATVHTNLDIQHVIKGCLGSIHRSAFDLAPIMKVMIQSAANDIDTPVVPWRDNIKVKKRIGIIRKISFCELSPAATRALTITETHLKAAGYEIIELDVDDLINEIIFWGLVTLSSSKLIKRILSGKVDIEEPLTEIFKVLRIISKLPDFLIHIAKWKEGDSRLGTVIKSYIKAQDISTKELKSQQKKLHKRFIKELDEAGVDAFISIGLPIPAIKLYSSNKCMLMNSYLSYLSMLNLVSGVVPVTKVLEGEEMLETEVGDDMTESLKKNLVGSVGLPMGVSINARPFHEEVVVKLMEEVEMQIKRNS